ncbi:MAG: OmpA family protein, partial [Pseudomonadota bacterium]
LLNREGWEVANTIYTMHPTEVNVALERSAPAVPFVADSTQLERIRMALAPEIEAGQVDVGSKGDFIFVRVGNLLLFDSGQASVKPEFADLGTRIAEVLNDEPGPIKVLGFTDSIPPSGRGQFRTNLDLSIARAQGVADVLLPQVSDPDRLVVEGRGEADPIADNDTREGRAQNRRVEVLIAKEGTF